MLFNSHCSQAPGLRRTPKLRRAVGARLQARHVPRLEFRHDSPSPEEAAVDAALDAAAAERRADEAERALRPGAGSLAEAAGGAGGLGQAEREAPGAERREADVPSVRERLTAAEEEEWRALRAEMGQAAAGARRVHSAKPHKPKPKPRRS